MQSLDSIASNTGGIDFQQWSGASLYHNGILFAIIREDWPSTNSFLYKWNGLSWSRIPSPDGHKLLLFQNEIYLLGYDFYKLNGTSWINLNAPVGTIPISVFKDMAVFNNEIIIGGNFSSSLSDDLIKFDGTNFNSMPNPGNTGLGVEQIQVFNNQLYISGPSFSGTNDITDRVLKLQGTSWVKAANYYTGGPHNPVILSVFPYKGSLYAQNQNYGSGDYSLYELGNDTLFNKGNVQFEIIRLYAIQQ